MSEMKMKNAVETEEFTDELCDEALDREGGKSFASVLTATSAEPEQ